MSVLNTMLQDLEKRHGQSPQSAGLPTGVKVIADAPKKPLHIPLMIGLTLVLIGLLVVAFQMRQKHPAPVISKVSPTRVLQTPAAVVQIAAKPTSLNPTPPIQATTSPNKRPPDAQKKMVISPLTNTNKPAPALGADKPEKPQNTLSVQKSVSPIQNAEYQYQQALESIQQGLLSDAISQLKQALQLNPRHGTARKTLAGVLLHENKNGEAEQVLIEGQNLDPTNLEMAMTLARLQVENGSTTSALSTLERSSSYAGQSGDFLAFEASLYQKKEEHANAINLLIRALQTNPGNGKWRLALAVSQRAQGQNQFALKNAQAALESNLPHDLQLLAQQIIAAAN